MTALLLWVLVSFAIALVLGRAIHQSDCTEQPAAAQLPTHEEAVAGAAAVEHRPAVPAAAAAV